MRGAPFGRYRLLQLLGRGGMGEVWRAYDTAIDRVVALKVLPRQFADDRMFQERFRREARAAAGLDDPHVVPIHDCGEIGGRLYVTMRLINGRDVQSILASGPLEPSRAVSIVEQIASALHAAHRIGLVHRDVKPSNILVAEDDFAYLIDFGIARATGQTKLTSTGNVVGTWAYLAPERLTAGQADARADIYSLTCVLHECLTGSQPFPSNSLEQQIAAHVSLPPPRPSELRRAVPAELDAVVAKGMAKDPDDRYSTTKELARAARAAITGGAATGPRSGWRSRKSVSGDVPRFDPGRDGPPTDPDLGSRLSGGFAEALREKLFRKRGVIVGAAGLITVLAMVAALVVYTRDSSPGVTGTESGTAGAATGPFTGTFTADVGPLLDATGKPAEGAEPPYQDTWRLRSVCLSSGCVATAATGGRLLPTMELVFDDVGGRWLAVVTSQDKCNNVIGERFDVVWLQPRPDGTMSGEKIAENTQGCYGTRAVTVTRIGDTDVSSLTDPAGQPPRVVSPAEALHGRYHTEIGHSNGAKENFDFSVRTDCLRTGVRCMSIFQDGTFIQTSVFADGTWTRRSEYVITCPEDGRPADTKVSAEFPLPQPLKNPITELSGHGRQERTGSACGSTDFNQRMVRTGD